MSEEKRILKFLNLYFKKIDNVNVVMMYDPYTFLPVDVININNISIGTLSRDGLSIKLKNRFVELIQDYTGASIESNKIIISWVFNLLTIHLQYENRPFQILN